VSKNDDDKKKKKAKIFATKNNLFSLCASSLSPPRSPTLVALLHSFAAQKKKRQPKQVTLSTIQKYYRLK